MTIGARVVVPRVATRAIGLIGWRTPGDRLAISAVAVRTVEPVAMVSGIGRARVIERRGLPVPGAVTGIARERRCEMPGWRAGRDHSVVAAVARSGRDSVVVKTRGYPTIRGVAEFAVVSGRDVTGVLSWRGGSVVAADAVRRNAGMIEGGRGNPSPRRVAQLA